PYEGKVCLVRSPGHPLWCSYNEDYGWGDLARGGVAVTIVPGAHEKILEEPCVQNVAEEVRKLVALKRSPSRTIRISAPETAPHGKDRPNGHREPPSPHLEGNVSLGAGLRIAVFWDCEGC